MSRGPSRTGSQSDLPAEQSALLGDEATRVNLTRDESETRSSAVVPVGAANEAPAPQGPSAVTRMFGCLFQVGAFVATPFRAAASAVYENPKKALAAAFITGLTVSFDLCTRGFGHLAGKPEGYCNDGLKTLTGRPDVLIATVGTTALLATMFVAREFERSSQLAVAADADATAARRPTV